MSRPSSAMLFGTTNFGLCKKWHAKVSSNWSSSLPLFVCGGPPSQSVQCLMGLSPCLLLRLRAWRSPEARPVMSSSNSVPANVERMLSEWAGRRESLALRMKVALALGPAKTRTRGRALNSNVFLLPPIAMKTAAKEFAGWTILGHEDKPERTWTTDELGSLTTNSGHRISQLRLARIADSVAAGWQITRQSVGRARTSGMTADQILGWLDGHLTAEVPALLEVAVRNWTGRQSIKLSQVQLLRIVQPQAKEALLHSATFRPFLGGHIPPDWFVVRDEHLSEVRGLLERLGFTIGDSLDPPPLEGLESPAKDSPAAVDRTNSIAK